MLTDWDQITLTTACAAAQDDNTADLARLEFALAVRSGLNSLVRQRQLAAMPTSAVRLDKLVYELPATGTESAREGDPMDRMSTHPLGQILMQRRAIIFDTRGTLPPGCKTSYFPESAMLTPELNDEVLQQIEVDFGQMSGLLRSVRLGEQSHNSVAYHEWRRLHELATATDEEFFGLDKCAPSGCANRPRTHKGRLSIDQSPVAHAIQQVIREAWRSAGFQERTRDTRPATIKALRARAAQEVGLTGASDNEILEAAVRGWDSRWQGASIALHLLFLADQLKYGLDAKSFDSRHRALRRLASLSRRGVVDLSRQEIQNLRDGLADCGSGSLASQVIACAATFGMWMQGWSAQVPGLRCPDWAGSAFRSPQGGNHGLVSLVWPNDLSRLRTVIDDEAELLLDLLLLTGARVESASLARPSLFCFAGEPYVTLLEAVKHKGKQRARYRAHIAGPRLLVEKLRNAVALRGGETRLVELTSAQFRYALRLDGRPINPHDMRRTLVVRALLREPRIDSGWVYRIVGRFNWRDRESLFSYAVCIDHLANQEADLLIAPALERTVVGGQARALSGLPAGLARRAFRIGDRYPLREIIAAQSDYLRSTSRRADRCRFLSEALNLVVVEEMVEGADATGVLLRWVDGYGSQVAYGRLVAKSASLLKGAARKLVREIRSQRRPGAAILVADGRFSKAASPVFSQYAGAVMIKDQLLILRPSNRRRRTAA